MNKWNILEKNKRLYALFLVAVVFILAFFVLFLSAALNEQQKKIDALSMQLDVTNKNHQLDIQQLNEDLGLADSELTNQKTLSEQYKKELTKKDEDFEKERQKYKLEIKSKDKTIAVLSGRTNGGNSGITTYCPGLSTPEKPIVPQEQPVIGYFWEDHLKRFHLEDPDVFVQNNETFTYSQNIKVKGEVFKDKTGNLQVRRVAIEEVTKDGQPIKGSAVSVVESKFDYINEKLEEKQKKLIDVFTFRPLAMFDIALQPGIGFEVANLGRYVDYANIGLYGKVSADVSDPLNGSLQNSRIGIGLNYHFVPPVVKTNFAIGAAVNLPFNKLDSPVLTVDAILYLTEDLNPFVEK
jgi:hypothetical protein